MYRAALLGFDGLGVAILTSRARWRGVPLLPWRYGYNKPSWPDGTGIWLEH